MSSMNESEKQENVSNHNMIVPIDLIALVHYYLVIVKISS